MRILHVTDCYLPRLGGIETQVADLVRHQAADAQDVHVLTSTAYSGDTCDCISRVRGASLREMVLARARATHILTDLRPDVLHCHNSVLSPLALAVAAAGSDLGIPTAITVHSLLPAWGPLLPMSGSLFGMRRTRIAWSAVSEAAARPLRRLLGRNTRVDVLPNAVDVGWWRDVAPSRQATGSREVRVVTVGRLAVRKRPLALIDIMARVRHQIRADVPLRLVLVGDG